jgi:hypothetical protein
MASGFIPPVNYGLVEEDLHRSGQPNEMNLRFIERLGLNKVIYLSPDDPDMVFMVRGPRVRSQFHTAVAHRYHSRCRLALAVLSSFSCAG